MFKVKVGYRWDLSVVIYILNEYNNLSMTLISWWVFSCVLFDFVLLQSTQHVVSQRALLNCNVSGQLPMFYSFDREGEREQLINVGGLVTEFVYIV